MGESPSRGRGGRGKAGEGSRGGGEEGESWRPEGVTWSRHRLAVGAGVGGQSEVRVGE